MDLSPLFEGPPSRKKNTKQDKNKNKNYLSIIGYRKQYRIIQNLEGKNMRGCCDEKDNDVSKPRGKIIKHTLKGPSHMSSKSYSKELLDSLSSSSPKHQSELDS